jgi:dTDP-4-dehydrorhamnose 3,5-epimerase
LIQCNISFNKTKGTIRGIHYQKHPYEEAKFVKCVKGKVIEVFVDLRNNSKTYLHWGKIELDSEKLTCLYIPEGIGLGFQTLEDNSELHYQMSQIYDLNSAKGIRWNDPKLKIDWPLEPTVISDRDISFEYL